MTPELQALLTPLAAGIGGLLLAGNLWFIRQLVISIKENNDKTSKLEVQMAGVMGRLDGVAALARDYPNFETKVEVLSERLKSLKFAPEGPRR